MKLSFKQEEVENIFIVGIKTVYPFLNNFSLSISGLNRGYGDVEVEAVAVDNEPEKLPY